MANTQHVREVWKLAKPQKKVGEEKVERVKEGQAVKDKSQKKKTTKAKGK